MNRGGMCYEHNFDVATVDCHGGLGAAPALWGDCILLTKSEKPIVFLYSNAVSCMLFLYFAGLLTVSRVLAFCPPNIPTSAGLQVWEL